MKELNKTNSFKTPEGYFEDFTDKLLGKMAKDGPALPKKEGFKVPNGYFEALDKEIVQKLNPSETKVIPMNTYRKYYYTAAAVAAVLLLVFGLQWNSDGNFTFEDLANSDIDSYFDNTELGFSTYEIAEMLPLDGLEVYNILENQPNEENILEYLNNTTDNFEDLNLEDDEYGK